jgi:hypothetical protein
MVGQRYAGTGRKPASKILCYLAYFSGLYGLLLAVNFRNFSDEKFHFGLENEL